MNLGQLALSGVIGPLFVGHGTQKLMGWFGGHGLDGTGVLRERARPAPRQAPRRHAGLGEKAGGALLTLGALTPLASATISGTMVTAIRRAHARNDVWTTNGGYEYNLVLLASMLALSDLGPGEPSVDAKLFPRLHGPAFALLQLAAGVAGSYLATERLTVPAAAGTQEGSADVPADLATADAGTNGQPAAVGTAS